LLVKRLSEFKDIHLNQKIVVCGCGISLLEFKEHHQDFITIGVNDVPKLFTPTYLVVTDASIRFNDARKKMINESQSRYMFTCSQGWRHPRMVHFDLGRKGTYFLNDPNKVDHFLNSPYVAINIAYKLGARKIGMIGVDFTYGHFYAPKDGQHSLDRMNYTKDINRGYEILKEGLNENGCELYNLSQDSKIESVPKITINNFKEL
jgi:hypothetical protein